MRWRLPCTWLCIGAVAAGCASQPDRFYTLNSVPEADRAAASAPSVHALLNVTIPVLVDRAEMIVTTNRNEMSVLDHERWAAPLSDLVSQTLARDIERRRGDVMVADRRFDQGILPPVTIKVDIVRMAVQLGNRVSIEAHWRFVDGKAGLDKIGSGEFDAPLAGGGYAPIAHAYSLALGELADALAGELAPP